MLDTVLRIGGLSLACLLAAALDPANAAAEATITGQDRSVATGSSSWGGLWQENQNPFFPDFEFPAVSYTDDDTDTVSAPGLGPFDAAASSSDPPLLGISPGGTANASQTSSLGSELISASGSFSAGASSRTLTPAELAAATALLGPPFPYDFGFVSGYEDGNSDFSVSFSVSRPTSYVLSASVAVSALGYIIPFEGFEITSANAIVELSGPAGVLETLSLDSVDGCSVDCLPVSDSLEAQGTLAPGSYTLTATVTGSAGSTCTEVPGFAPFDCYSPSSDGSFELSLALDTPEVPALPEHGLSLLAAALAVCGALRLTRGARA